MVAWILAVEQIPQTAAEAMLAVPGGNIVFLVLTAVLFILLGAVLEGLPAVVILLPTFMPVVTTARHRRRSTTARWWWPPPASASSCPPIGVGFFIACGIARVPGGPRHPRMMPYVYMMCVGLLIVILVPWVTLILPRLPGPRLILRRAPAPE